MKNNRVGLWAAGAVVLVAVVIGVVGLLWPRPGDTLPAATDNTSQPSTPTGDGPCPKTLPASTTSTVPADLRWAASQGVTWPVSDTVGPTSASNGFPTCFQQSPIGAALFGVSFFASTVDHTAGEVVDAYLVDGAEKDTFLSSPGAATNGSKSAAAQLKTSGATYAGYRIDSYAGTTASVVVVLAAPRSATGYRGVPLSLVWDDSSWKLATLNGGSAGLMIDVLSGQFTGWQS